MVEILKSNWFVVLIAIIIISFVVYFIYDENKYNVSGKSVDGHSLLAAVGDTNITADQLFEEETKFDQTLLYQMYKVAVLKEAVEVTSDMKSEAKTLESTIRTNFQSQYGDDYETTLNQQLANYGFTGDNPLYDYCVTSQLEKAANYAYVDAHFDEEAKILEQKNPRTISILKISVEDAENLTEEEQKKKDDIDALIESDGFEAAVKAFSEDVNTVQNNGFVGYVDSDELQAQSPTVDPTVLSEALTMEKGAISDWITVRDMTGYTYLYKVRIDETDIKTLYATDDAEMKEKILFAFVSADNKLTYSVIEDLASKVDVKFEDEKTKEKIQNLINEALAEDEEVVEEVNE